MNDLTILYYTANKMDEGFAQRVRAHLLEVLQARAPVISISQEPVDCGDNICVGPIGYSAYMVYWQILIGAKQANTEFVACCEDDSLYNFGHFEFRPEKNAFYYNRNRWIVEITGKPKYAIFRWRRRTTMGTCMAPTQLMIETLETRFKKFPDPVTERYDKRLDGWGEPGRYEGVLHLPKVGIEFYEGAEPILTFNHKKGLGGLRRAKVEDKIVTELEPWGQAQKVWDFYHG